MKITIKNLHKNILMIFLILLPKQTIIAEQDQSQIFHEDESSEFNEECHTRAGGVNPQLASLLARLANTTINSTVNRINGNNSLQTLSSLSSSITNLGTPDDATAMYETLLSIIVANGIATPLALMSLANTSITSFDIITAQLSLIQLTAGHNPAITTLVTPNTGALANYNSEIDEFISFFIGELTIPFVQTYVANPTTTNKNNAVTNINSAVSDFNNVMIAFNLAINGNQTITSPYSYIQINSALITLGETLLYLQLLVNASTPTA
ncbi:MAG: hypothetical protein JO129_03125 [Candidatus Dependentiae bacterium]|nr:hypothetical protein [Candidatus Dependentiae bacterium]